MLVCTSTYWYVLVCNGIIIVIVIIIGIFLSVQVYTLTLWYVVLMICILYRKIRDLQQSNRTIQESYRTRKFELECSISESAPVPSSVHWNGTYPTLKTFLRFFDYRSFEGVEAPEG